MPARVLYITDPACPYSWGIEPQIRRLLTEFGDSLAWTFVMGGLARSFEASSRVDDVFSWLDASSSSRMPVDALLWREAPLRSSYPACMAVKAAFEQSADGGATYLRAVREGIMCFRAKLDTADALIDVARRVGLDGDRMRLSLDGSGAVEDFGADLEVARSVPEDARAAGQVVHAGGRERVPFPTLIFSSDDGARVGVYGAGTLADYFEAAVAVGGQRTADSGDVSVSAALQHFRRMATEEIAVVRGLRGPRAEAELWRMAAEFEVKPTRAGTGWLWEPA